MHFIKLALACITPNTFHGKIKQAGGLRTSLQPSVSDPALEKPYKHFQGENSYAEILVTDLEGIEGNSVLRFFPFNGFLSS